MAFINTEELQHKLDSQRDSVQQWVEAKTDSARATSDQHQQDAQEQTGAMRDLALHQEALDEQAQGLQRRLGEEAAVVQGLQRRLQELRATEEALPAEIDWLEKDLQSEVERSRSRATELAASTAEQRAALDELQGQVQRFEMRLGLRFPDPEPGQQDLPVVYTQVDAANPEQEFSFGVHVTADKKYEVSFCKPEVAALPDILQEVNGTQLEWAFSLLVRRMRQAFQEEVRAA